MLQDVALKSCEHLPRPLSLATDSALHGILEKNVSLTVPEEVLKFWFRKGANHKGRLLLSSIIIFQVGLAWHYSHAERKENL